MPSLSESSCLTVFTQLTQIFCDDFKAVESIKGLHSMVKSQEEKPETKNTILSQVLSIFKGNDPYQSENLSLEENGKQINVPAFIEGEAERIGFLKMAMQLTSAKQISNKINNTFLEWIITLLSRS